MNPRRALVFSPPQNLPSPPGQVLPPQSAREPAHPLLPLPPALRAFLGDFRLLTNQCLREAIASGKTARGSLSRFARTAALQAQMNGGYARSAADVALSLAKAHHKRLRHGIRSRIPYVRTTFLRAGTPLFHFDPESGRVRLSLRRGEWTSFTVHLSNYHRRVLADPRHRVTQLHLNERRMILIFEKSVPEPYAPTSLIALDTNESSLDGVRVGLDGPTYVRIRFPELRAIQAIHFGRRRYLGRKKAHDRRVQRRLLDREGRRERHRIRSRLHALTRTLVNDLARTHSALVLEDLSRMVSPRRRSRAMRRRLSSWPRAELHRQLRYKAEELGVPVYLVDPFRTSRTCPRCGEVTEPRRRVGPRFDCRRCSWSVDRQLNAGVNLGRTVLREHAELGGLRLDLDGLSEEAVRLLYPTGGTRSGTSGAEDGKGEGSGPLP